jgi:hypothetical protein
MRITLLLMTFITASLVFSQKEFVNINDASLSDVRAYIKQNNPTIYLLDGSVSLSQLEAKVIYADLASLDLISEIDFSQFNGSTLIVRSKTNSQVVGKIIALVNSYSGNFFHVHIIIEESCSTEICFSSAEKQETLNAINQPDILISFEEEKAQ